MVVAHQQSLAEGAGYYKSTPQHDITKVQCEIACAVSILPLLQECFLAFAVGLSLDGFFDKGSQGLPKRPTYSSVTGRKASSPFI
jgi:hypothetical protein